MGILGIVFLLVVLIAFTTFIVLIVKSARGWGGLQVTCLIFLFISTLVFMYSAAGVLHRRVSWVRYFEKQKKLLAQNEAEMEKILHGDITSLAADTNALTSAVGELNRLTVDRGRVWRGATLNGFNQQDGTFQLQLQTAVLGPGADGAAPAAAPAAADANAVLLPEQFVVFAFAEESDQEGKLLPVFYLGEYQVVESKGANAKLRPSAPLTRIQQQAIAGGRAARWTIYELMPLDSHEAFAATGSRSSPEELFGHMDPEATAKLLGIDPSLADPNVVITPANAAQVARLQVYLRDGKQATDDAAPESVWLKIEFVQEHTIDVDSQEERIAEEGGYFDMSGRTVDSRLKRGKEASSVKFSAGDQRVFLREEGEALIKQGVAKLIERYYVRPLNDYHHAFRNSRQSILATLSEAEYLKRELALTERTRKVAQEQIAARQVEQEKLKKDVAQYLKEQEVIQAESVRLGRAVAELESRIRNVYSELAASYRELSASQGFPISAPLGR